MVTYIYNLCTRPLPPGAETAVSENDGGKNKRAAKTAAIARSIARSRKGETRSVLTDELTEKQAVFVDLVVAGVNPHAAAGAAGYAVPAVESSRLALKEKVAEAIDTQRRIQMVKEGFTRQDVLDGIKAAIDDAKILADPSSQIAGWREVAKICGYYAPELKKLTISSELAAARGELEQLSDEALLSLAAPEPIEGESSRVDETSH